MVARYPVRYPVSYPVRYPVNPDAGGGSSGNLFFTDNAYANQFFTNTAKTNAYTTSGGKPFDNTMNALFVGQSLMARGFTFYSDAGGASFVAEAKNLGYSTVNAINGALDSAGVNFASNQTSGSVGSYLASDEMSEGTVFTNNLVASVVASGIAWTDIDIVFYMIGNRDSLSIVDGFETEAQHKAAYKRMIDLVRARAVNAMHVQCPNIGELFTTPTTLQEESWTAIERAQYQVLNENSYVLQGCAQDDLTRADFQHPDMAGFQKEFARYARVAAHYQAKGPPVNPLGSFINSASFNTVANDLTVNVTHDGGTDFTISNSGGFWIYVNGVYQKPTTATRISATSFKLSGGLTFTHGDSVTLSYAAGTHKDMDNPATTSFLDNSINPLSLRHVFGFIASEVNPVTIQSVIASAVADWSPVNADSYSGTGQIMANRIDQPADGSAQTAYDVFLGTSATPGIANPTFNGTPNTNSNYFSFNGAEFFRFVNTNPAFISAMSKTTGGSNWWYAIAFQHATTASTRGLFGMTNNPLTAPGVDMSISTANVVRVTQRQVNTVISPSSTVTLANGTDYVAIFSYDHASSNLRMKISGHATETVTHTYDAGTADATTKSEICALGGGGSPAITGFRFYECALGNAALAGSDEDAIIAYFSAAHGRSY